MEPIQPITTHVHIPDIPEWRERILRHCCICGDPMSERMHAQCRAQARAEAEEPEREPREGE